MSSYLNAVDSFGSDIPEACAFKNSLGEALGYGELKGLSDSLAAFLLDLGENKNAMKPKQPIVVYGHKSPYMIVCFLACLKSGHPYVPLDTSLPESRAASIVDQLENPILLNTTDQKLEMLDSRVAMQITRLQIEEHSLAMDFPMDGLPGLAQDDTQYIIFTSGSTGEPKGVEITAECVDNFWRWIKSEFLYPGQQIYFNRAPFSFDLSVTDLILGLGTGGTLFALVEEDEADLSRAFKAFSRSGATFWISTPSFIDICMRDPGFNSNLLPDVRTFFFVGEVLRNETAGLILDRFPRSEVINGYGPTESTDLVTAVRITEAMICDDRPLPVGKPKPGTILKILDPETLEELPAGKPGELYIIGDTVGKGYYHRPDLTAAAFFSCPGRLTQGSKSYKTGDKAMIDEDGMLHFHGRLDFQVKLHGYRIELGDIEMNLGRLEEVEDACVIPVIRKKTVSHLAAYVIPSRSVCETDFALNQRIRKGLKELIPEYMIPRKIEFIESFPLTANGKIDRSKLRGQDT